MIFTGYSFYGYKFTASPAPVYIKDINAIALSNGIFNDLFISSDPNRDLEDKEWTFDTILHGDFNGNLLAGNADVSLFAVSSILIKRRRKGSLDKWVTLFEIPIGGNPDNLEFERFDKYVASSVEYEWALIPVSGNVEGNYNINSLVPDFQGIFIVTKDKVFNSILDNDVQVRREKPSAVVRTIDGDYPYVISHSKNKDYSGSVSAVFIENENCEWKYKEGYQHRRELMDFLLDGYPKMLKLGETGETFLMMVVDNIPEDRLQYTDKVTTTFQFNEIGNSEDMQDLYDSGLIDISTPGDEEVAQTPPINITDYFADGNEVEY